jgi:hypothetical protein
MDAVISMFWNYEAEWFHVFIDLINHYRFDTDNNSLNGIEVYSTKLLCDIWIISYYELLHELFNCRVLIFTRVSKNVVKHNLLDILNNLFMIDKLK